MTLCGSFRRSLTGTGLALALVACGPRPPAPVAAAGEVRALVARYDSAWNAKDSATVARLLAADYAYFTSTGRLSGRDDALGFLQDTSYVLTSVRRSEVRIAVAGPVARVASRWEGTGRFQGTAVEDDQSCGQIWVWDGGRWQLFSEHCVNRATTDSASPPSP
jgi:ketosteroid isomerase-like protein